MDPLDKLVLIIEGTISQKKKERERGKDKHGNLYIIGLDHEIDTLSLIRSYIGMIKRNAPSMADEMIAPTASPTAKVIATPIMIAALVVNTGRASLSNLNRSGYCRI